MLVLFETAAGFALFKLLDDGKLSSNADQLFESFSTPERAHETIKLKAFQKFLNTADALAAATAVVEGKLSSDLKSFLKKELDEKQRLNETLAVSDSKLGSAIAKKLNIKVVSDSSVLELMRGIRSQMTSLIGGLPESEMNAMSLGLAHSLFRYKLKFSPDKVDTMIIQAIALLDDLDKELNTYAMRVKEWYGWHFPEMAKVVIDNLAYSKCVLQMNGRRDLCVETNFDEILPEEIERELKQVAEISMGTEISPEDIFSISRLCKEIIAMTEYRTQLYEYLKSRMHTIAPNLTTLVGELVGARLISHAGSLLNLAKHPASTVQILGAEKALFRALKAKKDTPKYGLIYHASLVGQAGLKQKGKMARMLAAKASLACRVDALGDSNAEGATAETEVTPEIGIESRAKLENQLRRMEGKAVHAIVSKATPTPTKKYTAPVQAIGALNGAGYNASADSTLPESPTPAKKDKKEKKEKKDKKDKKKDKSAEDSMDVEPETSEPTADVTESAKKSKKDKKKESTEETTAESSDKKSKKDKKKRKAEEEPEVEAPVVAEEEPASAKKSKKEKKSKKSKTH